MKFIRILFRWLVLAIVLIVILAAMAFLPNVQTWVAQLALDRQTGVHGSLDSLSAGFGKVEIANLHLEFDGAVLTVPSLEARLSLTTAAMDRKFLIRSLVAKGWTLDLRRAPAPDKVGAAGLAAPEGAVAAGAPGQAPDAPAQRAVRALRGILGGWALPCDASLDGVDLEGDILVPAPPGRAPARVHLTAKGGGMSAGHEGSFAIDAEAAVADSGLSVDTVTAHGRLTAAMESPRAINRIGFKADILARGGSLSEDLVFSADLAAAREAGQEAYTLDLSRDNRHLATILAHLPEATRRFEGTWKVDLRNSDLAPFGVDRSLPTIAAAGDGTFDADGAFAQTHVAGRLNGAASHLGVLTPLLERLGAVTFDAHFDLSRGGQSMRVDRLSVSVAGTRPIAVVKSLQPFEIDESTGDVKVADPGGDWMEGSIQGFQLAWLAGLADGFTLAGGDASGDVVVRAAKGGFAIRSKTPIVAAGVSVQRAGKLLGQGFDVSASLLADYDSKGWQLQGAPLTVANAGRRLATIEGKASLASESNELTAIAGTWNADLYALASLAAISDSNWAKGLSATGDFSAKVGAAMEIDGKLAVTGHDPAHTVSASVRVVVDADGATRLLVPVKIAFGPSVSEVTADVTYTGEEAGSRIYVDLMSENVTLEQLGLLAAPFAGRGSASLFSDPAAWTGGPKTVAGERDRIPFWGNSVGRLKFQFDRLSAWGHDFTGVGGTLNIEHGSVVLKDAQGGLSRHRLATLGGSISFDAAAEIPYGLKATAALNEVDAAMLFAASKHGQEEPVLEGRFSAACTITGSGINLNDLAGRTQEEFRLTSTAGIIRLLKTRVGDSIPSAPSSGSDTLGRLGSAVGSFFGVEKGSIGSGQTPVGKTAEAVLNFTYQVSEIGYDQLTVTAIREPDRTIKLVEIAMTSPEECLTGSGQITYVKDLRLSARPLSLDLKFGVRGAPADLPSTAGLLSSEKDSSGYTMLNQPVRFGGTVEHIDSSQWHDLLATAANRKPAGPDKDSRGSKP